MAASSFLPKCLVIDIETSATDALELRKLGAWRPDTGSKASFQGVIREQDLIQRLDALAEGAAFVLGHNVARHDLPVLRQLYPQLRLHKLPIVDTLELSPIAFPQNPYHSLVKDYKLVRDSRSDPLKDAHLTLRLFGDQAEALRALHVSHPEELACHHYLLASQPERRFGSLFATIRHALPPSTREVRSHLQELARGKVCQTSLARILADSLEQPASQPPLAYVLAWLRVSGGNSVLPPWVRLQYPQSREFIRQLRETACEDPACEYCTTYLSPRNELARYFGFPAFRPEPRNSGGGSLQEDIARAGYEGRPLIAILPTGGGKSICYQLPALSRHWRSGSLTIVVSPLQSLMKDQVDNLVRQGIYSGAALNGLLTMPERRDVLDKTRLGDVGILFVSPEQFRNKAFAEAIRYREIGAWVFDEAHCLSRWGHDFRPDYLYVSRFIRERYSDTQIPVYCFTATAKREVIEDLRSHFRDALGQAFAVVDGGHERPNLYYEVLSVSRPEKMGLIQRLLEQELKGPAGGAIVFAARRKTAEEIAGFLKDMGWACAHFHAGLDASLKKEVQQAFTAGELRVIVATNAFGMGVDKPDVRAVIHAEIPGSLENYLQEAGRAGRDREEARCILLFDEEDVETQFGLSARSRLSRQDIAGILRTLRRYSAKTKSAEVVVTAGEILADDELETSIDRQNPDADTKVRTALAWLERARFLQRNENHTRVFPGSLKVGSLEEAAAKLAPANLSADVRTKYLDLLSLLINAPADDGISTDELMLALGLTAEECVRILHQLEQLGILTNDLALTVLLRKGVQDPSAERLLRVAALEAALLQLLPELAPDAEDGVWQDMNLRAVCQEVRERTELDVLPEQLLTLMRSLARPFGEEASARRAMFDVRVVHREVLRVRLLRSWSSIQEIAQRRSAVASVLLEALLGKLSPDARGVDLRVECKLGELTGALHADMVIGPTVRDDLAAIHSGLLYLHDNEVLLLDRGKTVFRAAMTIQVYPEERARRFTVADFAPLSEHYTEKNFQIHVIHEYARLGLQKLSDAVAFVLAYFTLPKVEFIRRYFAQRRDMLERATTEESYQRIVEDLKHPIQQLLVAEKPDSNRLILAGPGSGKTRVIVHRVAYLVRVLREAPEKLLVLAFNRSAAWEIRQRLRDLIGSDAVGVTVLTYHALALRLTGTSLASLGQHGQEVNFDRILDDAIALLEQPAAGAAAATEVDELRERLLAGYRYILVDEYQDIDAKQYALISGLAGRRLADPDAKLTILAVGDDDQNIYAFRKTSNEFIQLFEQDYQARVEYLVENYRSSQHIIDVANAVIADNRGRLKANHPIRINHARAAAPRGGRWEMLDAVGQGRVQVMRVPDAAALQTQVVMQEVERLKALDPTSDWSDFAILARTRTTLEPVRAWCELQGVRYTAPDADAAGQPKLNQTREGRALAVLLEAKPHHRVRPAGLARWLRKHFPPAGSQNPWAELLAQFAADYAASWGATAVPRGLVLDALYEFGVDVRRVEKGKLTIATVHGAKGREFRHVVILDSGDWRDPTDEERRLYYVGITRAEETLTLCEAQGRPNPFSKALAAAPSWYRSAPAAPTVVEPQLRWRFLTLGLRDVDLSFAGRCGPTHPVHAHLERLRYGDPLQIVAENGGTAIKTADGTTVGRLSQRCELPQGQVVQASVANVVYRTRTVTTDPRYLANLRVDDWWMVLPLIVVAP
jgi:ATP-dependent DNA helicase RecQ